MTAQRTGRFTASPLATTLVPNGSAKRLISSTVKVCVSALIVTFTVHVCKLTDHTAFTAFVQGEQYIWLIPIHFKPESPTRCVIQAACRVSCYMLHSGR